ncbi:MAG: transglutaminase family protein [Gammaproteobacteria bacterium]
MLFNVSCHLEYAVSFPSTLILSVHAQRNASQTILEEHFSVEPKVKFSEFAIENTGNRFVRIQTGRRKKLSVHYKASVDCDFRVLTAGKLEHTPVAELSGSEIGYLFPSRYCQSDRLGRLAWDLFGKLATPHEKVVAITDWIYTNVEYCRGSTNSETSAYDTVTQRAGVCRDFAHLGIALCRALNIPARYFTGYAYQLEPPDMHACFEAFIGGSWMIFDATRLAHLNGLVRVGVGRDAADASVASIFGGVTLQSLTVDCSLAKGQRFTPLGRKQLGRRGVALPLRKN